MNISRQLKAYRDKKDITGKFCCVHRDRPSVRFFMGDHICADCLRIELQYCRQNYAADHTHRTNKYKDAVWDRAYEIADNWAREERIKMGDSLIVLEARLKQIEDECNAAITS